MMRRQPKRLLTIDEEDLVTFEDARDSRQIGLSSPALQDVTMARPKSMFHSKRKRIPSDDRLGVDAAGVDESDDIFSRLGLATFQDEAVSSNAISPIADNRFLTEEPQRHNSSVADSARNSSIHASEQRRDNDIRSPSLSSRVAFVESDIQRPSHWGTRVTAGTLSTIRGSAELNRKHTVKSSASQANNSIRRQSFPILRPSFGTNARKSDLLHRSSLPNSGSPKKSTSRSEVPDFNFHQPWLLSSSLVSRSNLKHSNEINFEIDEDTAGSGCDIPATNGVFHSSFQPSTGSIRSEIISSGPTIPRASVSPQYRGVGSISTNMRAPLAGSMRSVLHKIYRYVEGNESRLLLHASANDSEKRMSTRIGDPLDLIHISSIHVKGTVTSVVTPIDPGFSFVVIAIEEIVHKQKRGRQMGTSGSANDYASGAANSNFVAELSSTTDTATLDVLHAEMLVSNQSILPSVGDVLLACFRNSSCRGSGRRILAGTKCVVYDPQFFPCDICRFDGLDNAAAELLDQGITVSSTVMLNTQLWEFW